MPALLWLGLGCVFLAVFLAVFFILHSIHSGTAPAIIKTWFTTGWKIFFKRPLLLKLKNNIHRLVYKSAVERALPALIDRLKLAVGGGHNLESAVREICHTAPRPWGPELKTIVWKLDMGLPMVDTLSLVDAYWRLPSLHHFVLAIKQSEINGTALSHTLSMQAKLLRARRKQAAEELAKTAAVKIALPLVLCIFPALMIIYLAPALLRLSQGL